MMESPVNCYFGQPIPRYWHQPTYVDYRFAHADYRPFFVCERDEFVLE